jgi:Fe2+ transport system protein FeoA
MREFGRSFRTNSRFTYHASRFTQLLPPCVICPIVAQVSKQKKTQPCVVVDGECAGSTVCPLSHVKAGTVVCIKQLDAAPEVRDRLREIGFGEKQIVKLLSRQSSLICQVCNARLGISEELADTIMVEPVGVKAA